MTNSDSSSSFNTLASDIQVVADLFQATSIASKFTSEFVDSRTSIQLGLDQSIHIGDHTLKASELLLIQRLLKEKYPEEYL